MGLTFSVLLKSAPVPLGYDLRLLPDQGEMYGFEVIKWRKRWGCQEVGIQNVIGVV